MRCEDARGLLLEADVADLDPDGASDLSAHLRSCARCAAAAADIRRGMSALDARLAAPAPDDAVDAVLARLGHAAGSAPRSPAPASVSLAGRRWRSSRWIPVAMAAGVAGLYFVARMRSPAPDEALPVVAAAPSLPLVESSGAQTVAVIETDNPDITVLWFF